MEYLRKLYGNLTTQKGFTLIELLIVIGVLAVLTTVSVALINPQLQFNKARDGTRKSDLLKIQSALELYRSNESYYPPSLTSLTSGAQSYIQTIPTDPNGNAYTYAPLPSGCDNTSTFCTSYDLWACLEYDDKDADVNRNPPGSEQCTGVLKSYTVSNP